MWQRNCARRPVSYLCRTWDWYYVDRGHHWVENFTFETTFQAITARQKLLWTIRPATPNMWRPWQRHAVAQGQGRHFVLTHQVVALFSVKWRQDRHLESVCHIRNLPSSMDSYLCEEQSCQISSWSDLKWRSLSFLKTVAPTTWGVTIADRFLSWSNNCQRSHLTMHRTIGLTDYYRTISDGLTGYRTIWLTDKG